MSKEIPYVSSQPSKQYSLLSRLIEIVAMCAVPVVLVICAAVGLELAALLSFVVVLAALLLFFVGFERGETDTREASPKGGVDQAENVAPAKPRRFIAAPRLHDMMPVVVLAALAAAGRILFSPFPDLKPVSAIAIIAGIMFGRRSGFMVGALAALASNFFFGQGAWTPWQMYAWGLVGYLAGVLAQAGAFKGAISWTAGTSQTGGALWSEGTPRPENTLQTAGAAGHPDTSPTQDQAAFASPPSGLRSLIASLPLYLYGFLSGLLYGFVLNLWSIVGFYHPQDVAQFLLIYASALPFDIVHGVVTVVFLLVLYAPWRRKLERVRRKYGLR